MDKFNYGRVLYDENIFDLEKSKDAFKQAVTDCFAMEKYFVNKVPSVDSIRSLIINSYRLNNSKSLIGQNRLYYTIGIAYSMEYINMDDLPQFISHIQATSYVDDSSVFQRKGFAENINGFFVDAFEEDLVDLKEVLRYGKKLPESKTIYYCTECGEEVNETDKVCPYCGENLSETVEYDENAYINVKDDCEEMNNEDDYEDFDEDLLNCYVDITPDRKIKLFKENFEEFINHQLERKNVVGLTKSKYVIKGMKDWFNYCIHFFDEALEIENNRVMSLTKNIGKYL